jgi:Bacteriocin-protection, YdeI or OmpD-Associated/Domain of unknown function (DUF1905)
VSALTRRRADSHDSGVDVHRFEAVVQSEESGGSFIEVPLEVRAVFGRARPPVKVTIGGFTWRTTIAVYGGRSMIGLRRDVRQAADVVPGDSVTVEVALDEEPRVVPVPDDLERALAAAPDARAFFDTLSYTHRKAYVRRIEEAKRADTRARRIAETLDLLREKKRAP